MIYDPRFQQDLELARADAVRERASKSGLAGMPTMLLIWLLPFLLIARAAVWGWRKVRPG